MAWNFFLRCENGFVVIYAHILVFKKYLLKYSGVKCCDV